MNWEEIGRQFLYVEEQPLLFHQGLFLLLFAFFLVCYFFVYEFLSERKRSWANSDRLGHQHAYLQRDTGGQQADFSKASPLN